MELFVDLTRNLAFTLGVVLIALLALGFFVYSRLLRARNAASYVAPEESIDRGMDFTTLARQALGQASGDEASGASASQSQVQVVDFRVAVPSSFLRRSFRTALRRMRGLFPGPRYRYQLPWFLSVGPQSAGKSTYLGDTDLSLPYGEPVEPDDTKPECLWWVFTRAVVVDVSGELVLRLDGLSSEQPAWRALLRLIGRARIRRPADAVLLTIPAQELIFSDPSNSQVRRRLADRGDVLRRRLVEIQERFGMRLPVYVVVPKCDHVAGFADFHATLTPEERRQMFGWSTAEDVDAPYSASWVDRAFDTVSDALDEHQMRTLSRLRGHGENRSLVAFPAALDALREPLRIYLDQIFSASSLYEPFPLRGIYFTGGEGFEVPTHDVGEAREVWGRESDHTRVSFLTDLFSYKVFYEWNLANPTTQAVQQRRNWLTTIQAFFFLFLLTGPLLLWWSGRRVGAEADSLARKFLQPSYSALERMRAGASVSDGDLQREALALVDGVNVVEDYRLRSLFLPSSWWNRYLRDAVRAVTGSYEKLLLPNSLYRLRSDLRRLASPPRSSPASAEIYGLETVPEFGELENRTDAISNREIDIDLYNCFVPLQCTGSGQRLITNFQQLHKDLYSQRFQPPTRRARDFTGEVMTGVMDIARYVPDGEKTDLRNAIVLLGDEMYRVLFQQNAVVRDLAALEAGIQKLELTAPPAAEAGQVYSDLLAAIDKTQRDLIHPDVAWVFAEDLDLGEPLQRVLRSITESTLLGLEVAQEIRRRGDAGFATMRPLTSYSTSSTGPLLAQEDGRAKPELAANLLGLQAVLQSLIQNDFMTVPSGSDSLIINPPPGTYLSWRAQALTEASNLFTSYESFLNQDLKQFEGLRQITEAGTRPAVELNAFGLVRTAQSFPRSPLVFSNQGRESFIDSQVDNLLSVSDSLNALLDEFTKPAAGSSCATISPTPYCLLTATLLTQQYDLLRQLDNLLVDDALYSPVGGDFSWWDGTGNLAWLAFDVTSSKDLEGYLARQRQTVQSLSTRYAQPVLEAVSVQDYWNVTTEPEFERWKVIVSDVEAVTDKKPDNAIQLVESFISVDMVSTTLASCRNVVPTRQCFSSATSAELTKNPPPCDYFLDRRLVLQTGIAQRCNDITRQSGYDSYQKIRQAFVRRLQGKYPWSATASQPSRAEATPGDVDSFFELFAANEASVANLFRLFVDSPDGATQAASGGQASPATGEESAGAASDSQDATSWWPETCSRLRQNQPQGWSSTLATEMNAVCTFMADVDQELAFFNFYLQERQKNRAAVPIYDLQVEFRVNRAREVGGNQIIDWTFEVGQDVVVPEMTMPGRWAYATPVSLTLRFAKDGPRLPTTPSDANARVVDSAVVYRYENPWSLISFLESHLAPPRDLDSFVDAERETLVFTVPTSPRDGGASTSSQGGSAGSSSASQSSAEVRVFMRLTLLSPDDKEDVFLPPFPPVAPNMPASILSPPLP